MSRGPAECRRAQSQEKNRNLAQAGPRCWRGDLVSHWSSCGRELRQLVNTERLFQLRNLLYRAFKAGAPQQLVLPRNSAGSEPKTGSAQALGTAVRDEPDVRGRHLEYFWCGSVEFL